MLFMCFYCIFYNFIGYFMINCDIFVIIIKYDIYLFLKNELLLVFKIGLSRLIVRIYLFVVNKVVIWWYYF